MRKSIHELYRPETMEWNWLQHQNHNFFGIKNELKIKCRQQNIDVGIFSFLGRTINKISLFRKINFRLNIRKTRK